MNITRLPLILLTGSLSPMSAAVLYAPTPIGSSARTSDYGTTSQSGFRAFDNFTVAMTADVEKVSWSGFWVDFSQPVPTPAPLPDALTWTISFHSDVAGTPGAALQSLDVPAGDVTSSFLGLGQFTAGGTFNVSHYTYSFDLPASFRANAATQYWVSIMALSNTFNPAWALLGATGGDSASYQHTLGATMSVVATSAVAADRAIALEGTFVPEPGTNVLIVAGLVALPLLRRRFSR